MSVRYFYGLVMGVLLLHAASGSAAAGVPTDLVKKATDEIISIISDPGMKASDRLAERDKLIRKAVDEIFDWEAFSRGTLARHWSAMTDQERQEFMAVFSSLLQRTYLSKVEDYSGGKAQFVDEVIDGEYAIVKSKVITAKKGDVPVEYRLRKKGTEWLVYDVQVNGVSLVNTYRGQFNDIIVQSSVHELINRLKVKLEQG